MTADRKKLLAQWDVKAKAFGFDCAALSIDDLWHLSDALSTVSDAVCGLVAQPRFQDEGEDENRPGAMLQAFMESLGDIRTVIAAHAAKRPAISRDDRCRKFGLLARDHVDGLSDPKAVLAEIAQIAATLNISTEF